jgi:hypothetical protein
MLIGLGLLTILLSLLFSFFTSSIKMDQKLQRAQYALLERQHLMNRLQSIFSSCVPPGPLADSCSLYTKKMQEEAPLNLITLFDQGIDPDPAFSGPCLARIYLNVAKQLCLAIWPEERHKENKTVREEILLQNVSSFEFRFLYRNAQNAIGWEKKWPKKEKRPVPSLIELDLWIGIEEQEAPNLTLSFILPSQEPKITYKQKNQL